MTRHSFYPSDLCSTILRRCRVAGHDLSLLPDFPILESIVDTCYQASLLREENAQVKCRILVSSPDNPDLKPLDSVEGSYIVEFEERFEFSPHQVRKLSAAVDPTRALIGIDYDENGQPKVWGIVITGASGIHHSEGTVHHAILPRRLVIHILGSGHLVFAFGQTLVIETIAGQVLTEGFDPFCSEWLPKRFEFLKMSLSRKLRVVPSISNESKLCEFFVRDVAQSIVRRVLSLVRSKGHGGMLIFLNDAQNPRLESWLRIRFRFKQAEATDRFQQLMLLMMQRVLEVGMSSGISRVGWKELRYMRDPLLGTLDQALAEYSHFLTDMMSVDGSLVLNHGFGLIGFGGEILGDSHVDFIERALDLEADRTMTEPADSSGTRHRSAYRLVSSVQDAIVVVASQDGAVRLVAHQHGRLVYWPYLP